MNKDYQSSHLGWGESKAVKESDYDSLSEFHLCLRFRLGALWANQNLLGSLPDTFLLYTALNFQQVCTRVAVWV